MKIKLHTKGIKGSSMVESGEEPAVLFGVIVEIDDEILLTAHKVEMTFEESMLAAVITAYPSDVEVIAHDKSSWEVFNERVDAKWREETARTGMGQALGKHSA